MAKYTRHQYAEMQKNESAEAKVSRQKRKLIAHSRAVDKCIFHKYVNHALLALGEG